MIKIYSTKLVMVEFMIESL